MDTIYTTTYLKALQFVGNNCLQNRHQPYYSSGPFHVGVKTCLITSQQSSFEMHQLQLASCLF